MSLKTVQVPGGFSIEDSQARTALDPPGQTPGPRESRQPGRPSPYPRPPQITALALNSRATDPLSGSPSVLLKERRAGGEQAPALREHPV